MQQIVKIFEDILLKGKIYIPRKWILVIAYYLVPLVLLVGFFTKTLEQESLGEIAQIFIIVILFVKPLSVILKPIGLFRTIIGYRRQLGISTFYFALFHFLLYADLFTESIWTVFVETLQTRTSLWYGAVALIVMGVLWITSNNIASRTLKRGWKWLQRIAYLLLPFVLIHSSLVEGDGIMTAVLVTAFFVVLKIFEWCWPRLMKNFS